MRWPLLIMCCFTLLLAACNGREDIQTGPRLVSDVTLGPPTQIPPTTVVTATRTPTPTPIRLTPEVVSPFSLVTVEANYVIVTPTLPPSKTPTQTPTFTPSPTETATPTRTVTATATVFVLPTSQIIPITQQVAVPINQVCDSTWFFIQPRPDSCPLNPPNASQGVYQTFENGHMVWVASQDAIYVLYNDALLPRWEVYRDYFVEGMVEAVSEFENPPAPNLWQPRRGFGLLWRSNAAVRQRIGWGTMELELPYSVQVQTANNGTLFISKVGSGVFGLLPNGSAWNDYTTASNLLPGAPPAAPIQSGGTAIAPLPGG